MDIVTLLQTGTFKDIKTYIEKNKADFLENTTSFILKGTKFQRHEGKSFSLNQGECAVLDLIVNNPHISQQEEIFELLYNFYNKIQNLDLKSLTKEKDIALYLITSNYINSFKKLISGNPEALTLNALLNAVYDFSEEDFKSLLSQDVLNYKNCFLNCLNFGAAAHFVRLMHVVCLENDDFVTNRVKAFYSSPDVLRTLVKKYNPTVMEKNFEQVNFVLDFTRLKGMTPVKNLDDSNKSNLIKILFNQNRIEFINKLLEIKPDCIEDTGLTSAKEIKEKIELKNQIMRKSGEEEVDKKELQKIIRISNLYYEKKALENILNPDLSSLNSNKKRI